MAASTPVVQVPVVESTLDNVAAGVREALPSIVAALVFLAVAYLGIRIVTAILRRVLAGVYDADQRLVVDLAVTLVGGFLWFGALLSLLKIIGFGDIAASLGTATGFVALGVSYALSDMIADVVSGVYLLRDPDFEVGDAVVTGSGEGVVTDIGLRKSRLRLADGDVRVIRNQDVEDGWTKCVDSGS